MRQVKLRNWYPDILKIIKIAVGTGLSIGLASAAGLKYSSSAGIITLLSIQNTKKETIQVAGKRLLSFLAAVVLAAVSFGLLGYSPWAIGLFLLFYAAVCFRFHMEAGLSVNTVLVTHFFAEQSMSPEWILNEALLLMIGGGIGVCLNLYIPGQRQKIRQMQLQIESRMKMVLGELAEALAGNAARCVLGTELARLEEELDLGEKQAYEEMQNNLLSETRYYLKYMNMRKQQAVVLERMERQICYLELLPRQSEQIAGLLRQISQRFHEHNNALGFLEELEQLKQEMREQPLPKERSEFENRAILYQLLFELEEFLQIKKEFVFSLSEKEIQEFWRE